MATETRDRAEQRLFVAVRPPPAVTSSLLTLPRPPTPGVRWVEHGQWHLTLRFLPRAVPAQVLDALDQLHLSQVTVTLGPTVISFENSVIVIPADGLDGLAASVLAATKDLGPVDPRPFQGHLTLARSGNNAECPLLGHPVAESFTATAIELVASDTSRPGPRHRVLRVWPLVRPIR